ncbi:hypothetical protein PF005_g22121 [Phytophthora fragariae]|uniref:Uncharacterized protein n=1 Tax=Phytophthora fragariae TaxID=53985 RepID=A0A6A3WDH2_9STRA|nr:hypothetical protein PF009_g18902 [Phytophthora fragariae]KAE9092523.1 hypothetical protein PF007_g18458 [Phytophthora fragariae]KAE9183377.1 hypothetical protein PF005_g22121 [Phytophthora fragariae]KAE9193847.1 hypothetical protein PF004_g20894 [Phytophthora fragariae]
MTAHVVDASTAAAVLAAAAACTDARVRRAAHEAVHVQQSASTPSPSTASALTPAEAAATKKKIAATRRRRSKIRVQEEKLESVMEKGSERRMIRVEDVEMEPPKVPDAAVTLLKRVPQLTINGIKVMAHALQVLVTDPAAVKAWLVEMKGKAKHELDHYWLGTKLLYADVSTSTRVLRRLLNATHSRVASLLLPVALNVFPSMLPTPPSQSCRDHPLIPPGPRHRPPSPAAAAPHSAALLIPSVTSSEIY